MGDDCLVVNRAPETLHVCSDLCLPSYEKLDELDQLVKFESRAGIQVRSLYKRIEHVIGRTSAEYIRAGES